MKPRIKPRNPFVASAKFRKAGPHEKSFKALRRQAVIALARIIKAVPERQEKNISSKCSSLGTQILPLWRKWSARLSEEQEDAVRFGGEAPISMVFVV